MKICNYCQEPITRGQHIKTFQSYAYGDGKRIPFLEPVHFHAECHEQSQLSLKATIEMLKSKGVIVNL